jgi:hypothetical protein
MVVRATAQRKRFSAVAEPDALLGTQGFDAAAWPVEFRYPIHPAVFVVLSGGRPELPLFYPTHPLAGRSVAL